MLWLLRGAFFEKMQNLRSRACSVRPFLAISGLDKRSEDKGGVTAIAFCTSTTNTTTTAITTTSTSISTASSINIITMITK